MNNQPPRSYLAIASAIVIAGVLISASLFVAVGQGTKTVTTTANEDINNAGATETVTQTTTVTSIKTVATQTITQTVHTNIQCTVSGPTIGAVVRVMNGTSPSRGPRLAARPRGIATTTCRSQICRQSPLTRADGRACSTATSGIMT